MSSSGVLSDSFKCCQIMSRLRFCHASVVDAIQTVQPNTTNTPCVLAYATYIGLSPFQGSAVISIASLISVVGRIYAGYICGIVYLSRQQYLT